MSTASTSDDLTGQRVAVHFERLAVERSFWLRELQGLPGTVIGPDPELADYWVVQLNRAPGPAGRFIFTPAELRLLGHA